jgi:hypothetical protein
LSLPDHRIVDAHAHLCDPVFDTDRPEVIKRARAAGVGAIIAVSENLSDAQRNIELASNHPELKPAAGLYPTYLDLNKAKAMISFIRKAYCNIARSVVRYLFMVSTFSRSPIKPPFLGVVVDFSFYKDTHLPMDFPKIHSLSRQVRDIVNYVENKDQ